MLSAPRRIQYESLAGRLSTFNDFLGSPELEGASRAHVKKLLDEGMLILKDTSVLLCLVSESAHIFQRALTSTKFKLHSRDITEALRWVDWRWRGKTHLSRDKDGVAALKQISQGSRGTGHSRLCYLSTILLEQINKNESLLKKYKNWDHHHGQSLSNCANQKGKSSLRSEDDLWLEGHSHASQSNEICNLMDAKVRNLNSVSSKP
ncbi:DNA polymerase epsilon catalytic subunit [Striga asiatica]|uniref:DNA polymerase epsilon catalytic subunit n=1 Tax=Striga asiatica TaxID=4170 RepID=A0A5A7QX68_STRAF|nr:DNA polymerase epsilon catalytic subunit [Striga asiatica]